LETQVTSQAEIFSRKQDAADKRFGEMIADVKGNLKSQVETLKKKLDSSETLARDRAETIQFLREDFEKSRRAHFALEDRHISTVAALKDEIAGLKMSRDIRSSIERSLTSARIQTKMDCLKQELAFGREAVAKVSVLQQDVDEANRLLKTVSTYYTGDISSLSYKDVVAAAKAGYILGIVDRVHDLDGFRKRGIGS
jgi:hypothetical protein